MTNQPADSHEPSSLAPLGWPLYLFAIMLFVLPPLDVVTNTRAFQPGLVRWRFGIVGLFTGILSMPILGLFVAILAGHLLRHRWVQRVLAVVAGVGALGLVAVLILFALDALQLRSSVNATAMRRYDLATLHAMLTQVLAIGVLAGMCFGTLRITRRHARAARGKARSKTAPPLVISTPGTAS